MAKPVKRKVQGGRTTPKGGGMPGSTAGRASGPSSDHAVPGASGRYTPPVPREVKVSPAWVPVLMFVLLGLGTVVILVNYTDALWSTSNWILILGLGLILAGILTATQYH